MLRHVDVFFSKDAFLVTLAKRTRERSLYLKKGISVKKSAYNRHINPTFRGIAIFSKKALYKSDFL